jgi:hypothetical protein
MFHFYIGSNTNRLSPNEQRLPETVATNLGRTSVCPRRSQQPENETLALQHPTSCPTYDTHFVPLRALMTVHPPPLNLKLPPPTGWWVHVFLERPCVAGVISVAVTTPGPPFQ